MSTICERGGTLLVADNGDIQAWLPLAGEAEWREISWRQENYPALHVAEVTATKDELAKFIQTNYVGWTMRKLNLPGIALDTDGVVIEPAGIT
jgi:hypothetical protein